jgi:hypothetical protein
MKREHARWPHGPQLGAADVHGLDLPRLSRSFEKDFRRLHSGFRRQGKRYSLWPCNYDSIVMSFNYEGMCLPIVQNVKIFACIRAVHSRSMGLEDTITG